MNLFRYPVILIFFFVLFAIAFFSRDLISSFNSNVVKEVTSDKELPKDFGSISLYFCPLDDCETILSETLRAHEDIDSRFFDLDLQSVISVLKEKKARLVIDHDNTDELSDFEFKVDDRAAFMHNKFCILDDSTVISGSMNPTINDATKNNNNLVIIESKILAENYEKEFEELWTGIFGSGEKVSNSQLYFNGFLIENYFCPDDSCEEQVLRILQSAEKRIYFLTFSFTSDILGEEIIKNFHYGIDVQGVFDNTQAGNKYSEFHKMGELGMNVKRDANPKFLHHKVFIVDDTVILGSYNPTQSGNKENDENILIIHDSNVAERFVEEFYRIWNL